MAFPSTVAKRLLVASLVALAAVGDAQAEPRTEP
jgi:hypothetical protein